MELPSCNVVMKGGITSGVVYPRAVARLARSFRLRHLGGASAGAIAASLAAAAEHRRRTTGSFAGFDALDALPEFLGENLFSLFEPEDATQSLFELLVAFLGQGSFARKLWRALLVGLTREGGFALAGLLPSALILIAAPGALGVLAALIAAVPGVALLLLIGFALRAGSALPENGFGISRGLKLTPWLADQLDAVSGESVLTFGHLWGPGDREEQRLHDRLRRVDFVAPTTSLAHGRPYRVPTQLRGFFWKPAELREYLPERIVKFMEDHSEGEAPSEGFLPLPHAADLPVVLAARLSLSFPFLLSAVPLYVIDYRSHELARCWMSDGGIGSNFPIHFFDAPLPRWPTFGLDLWPQRTPEDPLGVVLPSSNAQGAADRLLPFRHEQGFAGLGSFIGALLNALHAWMDNQQAKVPGFRDRIAHVLLSEKEGGLNLTMPAAQIHALAARGFEAGEELAERFTTGDGLENHRWIRLRTLLPLLRKLCGDVSAAVSESPDYAALLGGPEPSYQLHDDERAAAVWLLQEVQGIDDGLAQRGVDFERGEPRPKPVLRLGPDV